VQDAMNYDVRDRAILAEKLLASLDQLSEEEAERLRAEEAQRRLNEYRAGRAKILEADTVHAKVEELFR
ncbi:MAG: addiction module protein, partial [Nitrospiraceae bacterium]